MPYLGNLKSWLYRLYPAAWLQSLLVIRLLPLTATALAITLATLAVRRAYGSTPSFILLALLLTNPAFLLPRILDWGPLAFSSLLLSLMLYLALASTARPALRWALFGFLATLGLYDKLLFVFPLFPLTALAVYHSRPHPAAIAGFAFGATPLLLANLLSPGISLSSHTTSDWSQLPYKFTVLLATLDGSAIYPYLISTTVSHATLLLPLLAIALLLTRFRLPTPALLLLATILPAWLLMASRSPLAYSVHHTGLFAILFEIAFALLLAKALRPSFIPLLMLLLLLPTLRLPNALALHGPGPYWNPHLSSLLTQVSAHPDATPVALDWGISIPLQFALHSSHTILNLPGRHDLLTHPLPNCLCLYITATTPPGHYATHLIDTRPHP
jgi:hypothetical protein